MANPPDTLPADFFSKQQGGSAPDTLPADFFSGSSKPPDTAFRGDNVLTDAVAGVGNFLQGVGSGVISTGVGAYDLVRKIPGADRVLPEVSPALRNSTEAPDTMMGKLGKVAEQTAEFALPAGVATRATKGAGLLTRMAGQGAAAGTTALVQSGGNPVAAGTAMALGAAGPAVGAGASKVVQSGVQALEKVNPRVALTQALRPTNGNLRFVSDLKKAMPEIKAAEAQTGKPIESLTDLVDHVKVAKKNVWQQFQSIVGPQAQKLVDGSAIADAIEKSIPARLKLRDPQSAAKIIETADKYRRNFTVQEMENLLHEANAALEGHYAKFPNMQRSALAKSPEVADLVAEAEATRKTLYSALDSLGQGSAPRELMRRYGALMNVEESALRRSNVALRQAPENLVQQLTKSEAIGKVVGAAGKTLRGKPLEAVGDLAEAAGKSRFADRLRELNSSDGLIKRAFSQFSGAPKPVPYTPAP